MNLMQMKEKLFHFHQLRRSPALPWPHYATDYEPTQWHNGKKDMCVFISEEEKFNAQDSCLVYIYSTLHA